MGSAAPENRAIEATASIPNLRGYATAVALVGLALGLTLAIRQIAAGPTNFAFYIAIFVSTWYFGRGPGWLAAALAVPAVSVALPYLLLGTQFHFTVTPAAVTILIVMVLCAATADALSARRNRTEAALRAARDRLELTVRERTEELRTSNADLREEIAERKRVEGALRASEEWWRTIFETSNVPMGVTDLTGRSVVVNAATERLLGYSSKELRSISITELTHEDDRARTLPAFQELVSGRRKDYHVEKRYRCKDGSVKWLNATVSRVPDPKGGPDLAVGIVADITEQKRAEQALRASEERWRRVFESSAVAMALADGNRRIVAVNPACERLLGYAPEEFLAMSALDFKYGDDRAVSARMLEELEQGRRRDFQAEMRFKRKTGEAIWVNASVSYVPATEITSALFPAVIEDITERKRAEAALRASEERWRTLFQTASVGIATSDAERRISSGNAALQRMLGYSEAELPQLSWADLTHDDDSTLTDDWVTNLEQGRQQAYEVEKRYRRKDGKFIWCNVNASYIPATEGSPGFFATIIVDIDDRKQAETALRRAQAELARVSRATTVGAFAASIAHEINQPLAAMVASSAACQRWLGNNPVDVSRAKESASRMVVEANRASEVIKRIRSLMSNKEPARIELAINEVIREVLVLLRSELQSKQVSLRMQLLGDLPMVVGDRVQLEQVIVNLVMNAVEAMTTVSDRARLLVVRSRLAEPRAVSVAVEDSGTGLEPESEKRIFDAFFTTKADGMGMGLSISSSIIEAHGGRLWASRAKPHGTIFEFTLPVADGGPA